MKFDGKSDIVEIPHHKDLILGQYTIVAWIKPVANGKWRTVVGKEPAELPRSFGVYLGAMTMRLRSISLRGTNGNPLLEKLPPQRGNGIM